MTAFAEILISKLLGIWFLKGNQKICEYSTDDKLVNKENIEYNYKEFNDLLTNYNKKEIQYNQMGNPIQYGQKSIEWNHKELIEPGRPRYKGGISTYSNYINKWTGSKLEIHKIIKDGRFMHGPHFHPWI